MKNHSELQKLYEKQLINGEVNIPAIAFKAGEQVWRNMTPLVTIKDPLYNIKSLSQIIFNRNVYEIASSYLGEKARIGFVKVKKSYQTNNFSYNQIYHRDDNGNKILKLLIYLDDVSAAGGGLLMSKKV